jgi:hypothetical protein
MSQAPLFTMAKTSKQYLSPFFPKNEPQNEFEFAKGAADPVHVLKGAQEGPVAAQGSK